MVSNKLTLIYFQLYLHSFMEYYLIFQYMNAMFNDYVRVFDTTSVTSVTHVKKTLNTLHCSYFEN